MGQPSDAGRATDPYRVPDGEIAEQTTGAHHARQASADQAAADVLWPIGDLQFLHNS